LSKITKADLVDAIYNKIKMERREIKDVVDLFIGEVKSALVSHKVIELRGFGTFEIKIRKGREKARNPKTGELFSVGSHGVALFKAGRELRQDVWNLQREEQPLIERVKGQAAEGQTAERQTVEGQTIDEKTDKREDGT
jgi:integration host factor subunit beta